MSEYHGDDARSDVRQVQVEAVLGEALLLLRHHGAHEARHAAE